MSKARQLADLLDSNGDVVVGALDNAPDPDLTPYATTTYVDTEISGVSIDALDVNASAPADAIAIDANGRVGIGTTSPSNPLHVLATAAGETTVKIESNQAGAMFVALDVDTDRDCLLQFQEAGTTRWDIFMNGSSGTNPLLIRDDGGTTQGSFDQSGNFKFNSGYGSAATAYGCRAWVNFNGTGTVAIRDSGNVSSITDNGAGDYTVNYSNAMPDSNYVVTTCGTMRGAGSSELGYLQIRSSSGGTPTTPDVMSTTAIRLFNKPDDATTSWDLPVACVMIFR